MRTSQDTKYTVVIENNNSIPFLDVLNNHFLNGRLDHYANRKPTHTDEYLKANSRHHPSQNYL